MNTTGRKDTAMAPKTIFVLNREPGWCARRSAQRRNRLRVRMRPKTRSAATMKR